MTTRTARKPKKTPAEGEKALQRCAVYCRQSVADDLEFNSIDAQRQAVEAYARAQGWQVIEEAYIDHGVSGGTIDRPAFQRLLADVEAGKVDIVLVHRLDRLSRSIGDFVRILETFERCGVGLVSTTQAFDTKTPLGRMLVNLLATFATYERDMIRERTQEKMAATRRRGMWTGGQVILGYRLRDKRLVPDPDEVNVVREVFRLYLELRSTLAVASELNHRGLTTKARRGRSGKAVAGGKPWDKHSVRRMLSCRTYLGEVEYHGEVVPGVHEAIIDPGTWKRVQATLAAQAGTRERRAPSPDRGLLSGLLRCGVCGKAMGLHTAHKGARRYQSYVCAEYQKRGAAACPGSRVRATDIEAFVVERVAALGTDLAFHGEVVEAARREAQDRRAALEEASGELQRARAKLDGDRRGLVDAIAATGGKSASLLERLGAIELDLRGLDVRAEGLESERQALETALDDPGDLRRALEEFHPVWDALEPPERVRAIALLVERVVYDASSGDVEVVFRATGIRTFIQQGGAA